MSGFLKCLDHDFTALPHGSHAQTRLARATMAAVGWGGAGTFVSNSVVVRHCHVPSLTPTPTRSHSEQHALGMRGVSRWHRVGVIRSMVSCGTAAKVKPQRAELSLVTYLVRYSFSEYRQQTHQNVWEALAATRALRSFYASVRMVRHTLHPMFPALCEQSMTF